MRILYFPFVLLLIVSAVACNLDKPAPIISPPQKAESSINNSRDSDKVVTGINEKTNVLNPTIWHSPKLLIQKLGNLNNKIVANIGAGPYGYFSFEIADEAKKVIAIDIDEEAIQFIDSLRSILLPTAIQDRLETRLVKPDNPKLRFEEVDIVTIRETYAYLPDRINYLKNLKRGIKDSGKLLIVDFKMRQLPKGIGPLQSEKVPLFQVELDLEEAGYKVTMVDDQSLAYQYIILAEKA